MTKIATVGDGGEYDVQDGFGWTNGVALDLLQTYGHRLVAPVIPTSSANSKHSENISLLFVLLITFQLLMFSHD